MDLISPQDLVRTEDAKCRRFHQGLNSYIRSRVSAFEATTFTDLMNKAMIVEKDIEDCVAKQAPFKKSRFDSSPKHELEVGPSIQRASISQFGGSQRRPQQSMPSGSSRGTLSPQPKQQSCVPSSRHRRDVDCYKCGVRGHKARDCPSSRSCYHCGQLGHMIRDCPVRSADTTFVGSASRNRAQYNNPQRNRGSCTQAREFVMNGQDAHQTRDVVTGLEARTHAASPPTE
ncbi:uncharacterized protein LOC130759839 isoform X2 [Actinidia eriantha]|uniref:uncharacterized protein LOC130759778 isoform X2 n=1 Tax=Actinidia eriantha TaxID=165200 RepID=UPI002584AC2A|nr:uncharacterized protein LOC130759778 isoform X2 [Actinidia eriantha]XP_057471027.1 uncharacterized protein LOC130759839 isoform X2 [Actinidia eriantha]